MAKGRGYTPRRPDYRKGHRSGQAPRRPRDDEAHRFDPRRQVTKEVVKSN